MRTVKNTERRWIHRDYVHAFCFERDGTVHTSIDGKRRATGLVWNARNKPAAMKLLNERLLNKDVPAIYNSKKKISIFTQLLNGF